MVLPLLKRWKKEHGATPFLNRRSREIGRGGHSVVLQNKAMEVLETLLGARHRTVSREELIKAIWNGNHLTGEKGINQALWAIRNALGDDARNPEYIETVPRIGYRWIGPMLDEPNQADRWPMPYGAALAAVLTVMIWSSHPVEMRVPDLAMSIASPDGNGRAYRQGRDIIVERAPLQRYVLRPTGSKRFGRPTYSPDGGRLAFTAITGEGCELIVVEFETREYEKFTPCPGQI